MQEQTQVMLSNVLEQILLTNSERDQLVQSLRVYSKYQKNLKKFFNKQNQFAQKSELARFQKYLSLCSMYLHDWHNDLDESYSLMKAFLSKDYYLPLLEEFLNLRDDFPRLCARFEEITYACLNILGENKDFELYIIPIEEASEIFVNPQPAKPTYAPTNSLWSETAFLILNIENLEEELFDIIGTLQDMEIDLLAGNSTSYECSLSSFESLSEQALRILANIEENHSNLYDKLIFFYESDKFETDKTRAKFDEHFDQLFLPGYLATVVEAILKTCEYLIECNKINSTKKALDF